MSRSAATMRNDAMRIWQAGVDAVLPGVLIRQAMRIEQGRLHIGDETISLDGFDRLAIVGTGKAGAAMAAAVEDVLGPDLLREKHVHGWMNVPADCVRSLASVDLHAARAAGQNEPTAAGVAGSLRILQIVSSLGPRDLCLCLISGGGSALLPAPVEGVTLADKRTVTRHLSAAGANIAELNTVRKHISRIKGGGLARACRAGRLFTLIISDVIGDPLDVIASGPTVADTTTAADALAVLGRYDADRRGVPASVYAALERKSSPEREATCRVANLVIGNLATAVDAAGRGAEALGYTPAVCVADRLEGHAEDVGRHLANVAAKMRCQPGPDCLISGGEPVVRLVDEAIRGRGGRNQQLVLAGLIDWWRGGAEGTLLFSGGTDGEDGPTDAAGAFVDSQVIGRAREMGLDALDFLHRNDAYHFFQATDALVKTGPTGTNVCDVRIVLVDRIETGTL